MSPAVQDQSERRATVRMMCSELVLVQWEDPPGNGCTATGILEDISGTGACVQLEVPVSEGARLSIRPPGVSLRGTVRYCVFREAGYFVGLRFDDDCKLAVSEYRPQHLIDPLALGDPEV